MRKRLAILVLTGLLVGGSAWANDYLAPGLKISGTWSRPAAAGSTGAGFGAITNTGRSPVTLVSVQTSAARSATVHQTLQTAGIYSMKSTPGLVINPGQTVTFAPGGYHVMFSGLKAALVVGGKLPATLTFQRGDQVTSAPVIFDVGVAAPTAHQH